ncbi:MAG: amino acid adenylation domain-containing protein, partial [bacterium]|nr:amino acid adenylation domain-containing protein [bacterium]
FNITHINFVPSMLSVFLNLVRGNKSFAANCPVKYLVVAGEAFPKEWVQKTAAAFIKANVENIYGPTEASIYAAYFSCSKSRITSTNTPIGKPISNTKLYILDEKQNLAPTGIPGELCIAGHGLAKGYINKPGLTAETFIHNPFNPGGKLYRTGDLARWLPDGTIEYLGRMDFQVKIRGFRIEPGEIESQLNTHSQVKESAVIVKEQEGPKQLIAYYVPGREETGEEQRRPQDLKAYLKTKLPGYMIPAFFIPLDRMPLTD